MHFKRLGSRHIHKEINLQKSVNGMNRILCKTDLILFRRHAYKCNTFSVVDFEAYPKSAYAPLWYSQFQCNDIDLIWFLSELNTPPKQLSLSFWARIPRRSFVGHDNLRVEVRVFPIKNSHWHLTFMKIIKRTSLKNSPKCLKFLFCSIHYVLKKHI